eukprot:13717297-Heterocapsa_arctica.AAC.1
MGCEQLLRQGWQVAATWEEWLVNVEAAEVNRSISLNEFKSSVFCKIIETYGFGDDLNMEAYCDHVLSNA